MEREAKRCELGARDTPCWNLRDVWDRACKFFWSPAQFFGPAASFSLDDTSSYPPLAKNTHKIANAKY
jgi:hypothetical protein